MKQKTLISIILFIVITLIISSSFAAEEMKSSIGNMAKTATESVSNGIRDVASGTRDMVENITTNNSDKSNTDMFGTQESDYSATRTAMTNNNNLFGLSTTAWLWIIMGIVGAIIVGLVWYYGSQYENQSYNHNK